ncbi:saccharopine dehydrogenase family protein [Nocardia asteroides]|uniref:saccharopine dehydrogenase family protein n=1 Tax=Nocardia asteroides TaxID=1824 RepID=UPI0037BA0E44
MNRRIVLFGVTGYTGGLVLDALRRRGLTPVLAGRNPAALARIAEAAGGLQYRVADATEPAEVADLVAPGDILISTVGPFERYGYPVARAAADAGAHYIDSTGEVGFVLGLRTELHERAQRSGAVMLPAFGYDYVPGILAGTLAAQQAGPEVRRLDIGYFASGPMRGGISHGTRATLRDGLTLPVPRWQNRTLVQARPASAVTGFDVDGHRRNAVLATGTEAVLLPAAFPMLESVSVYNGWFPRLSHLIAASSAAASVAARSALGRKILEVTTRPMVGAPGGPDATVRARTRSRVVAVASSATTRLAEVTLDGPNAYSLTGELIAWAAHRLLTEPPRAAGVLGPVEAFGLADFTAGCAELDLRPR